MQHSQIKQWVLASAVAMIGAVSQSAMAHTVIQSQVTEATTTYNNLVIGHGCTLTDGSKIPVIAQSVVFPTLNPLAKISAGTFAGSADVFEITSFANIPKLIQSRDIFSKQVVKTDAKGNVIGFTSTEGSLDVNAIGLVPFRTAGINFKPASCIKKLLVQVAIADVCQKGGAANLWIPSVTPHFPNPNVDGIGAAPSLIFNRDMNKNPFLAASNCGDGYELTISPSPQDVDANLPVPGYLN